MRISKHCKSYFMLAIIMLGFFMVHHENAHSKANPSCDQLWSQLEEGALESTSLIWGCLSMEEKLDMVDNFKMMSKQEKGISIRRDSGFYVQEIDATRQETERGMKMDIGFMLKVLAIIYQDFDDGRPWEETAKEYLYGVYDELLGQGDPLEGEKDYLARISAS